MEKISPEILINQGICPTCYDKSHDHIVFGDNKEFLRQIKSELFTDKIYVYTPKGDIIELPKGSTVIDFAYKIHTHLGNTLINALVNDKLVNPFHKLENKDRVKIITDVLAYGPRMDWIDKAYTSYAKKRIKDFNRK